ncbi:unnamed protein product [Moneuplotes crassus]|uniref:Uncharacterized protein n=1 Tax=Euplotes crassus TaxID=5936 RepID=A0AAD1XAT7_EUPCR|nr:unnamed protein product [Moneuplotes crassus]
MESKTQRDGRSFEGLLENFQCSLGSIRMIDSLILKSNLGPYFKVVDNGKAFKRTNSLAGIRSQFGSQQKIDNSTLKPKSTAKSSIFDYGRDKKKKSYSMEKIGRLKKINFKNLLKNTDVPMKEEEDQKNSKSSKVSVGHRKPRQFVSLNSFFTKKISSSKYRRMHQSKRQKGRKSQNTQRKTLRNEILTLNNDLAMIDLNNRLTKTKNPNSPPSGSNKGKFEYKVSMLEVNKESIKNKIKKLDKGFGKQALKFSMKQRPSTTTNSKTRRSLMEPKSLIGAKDTSGKEYPLFRKTTHESPQITKAKFSETGERKSISALRPGSDNSYLNVNFSLASSQSKFPDFNNSTRIIFLPMNGGSQAYSLVTGIPRSDPRFEL